MRRNVEVSNADDGDGTEPEDVIQVLVRFLCHGPVHIASIS